jgi:hypothetical protein
VRKGAQVLRSFGKQNAHLLPTFLLMINHLGKIARKRKNYAVRSNTNEITTQKNSSYLHSPEPRPAYTIA